MAFNNPVVGSSGTLIRLAIHSPDYVAGISGWSINKDGTAEFNDVTVRGTLHVNGFDNSYVEISDQGIGQPAVTMYPGDIPGHNVAPGQITVAENGVDSYIVIASPNVDSSASAAITLVSGLNIHPGEVQFDGDLVDAPTNMHYLPCIAKVVNTGALGAVSSFTISGVTIGFTVPSAQYVVQLCIKDNSSGNAGQWSLRTNNEGSTTFDIVGTRPTAMGVGPTTLFIGVTITVIR